MNQQTALITGASGGIGYELACIHAANGHNLVLVARSEDKLLALKRKLERENNIIVRLIAKDLTRQNVPFEIHAELESDGIAIDFLINNAGIGDYGLFHNSEWEKQSDMINLNIYSLTYLTHLFSSGMVKRGHGRIMNIASTASFQPGPLMSVYYATKHFVLAFSEAIAQELNDYGVYVTAFCPGPTKSDFQMRADMDESRLVSTLPMASVRDVADFGYRAMMKGKRVAVHGLMNKILAQSVRFSPRKLTTELVRKIQETG